MAIFNARSAWTIYQQELMRAFRTAMQSILAPVLTTSLYFVVFGAAIGGKMQGGMDGVNYGAFIVHQIRHVAFGIAEGEPRRFRIRPALHQQPAHAPGALQAAR